MSALADKWVVAALACCRADPRFADRCTARLLGLQHLACLGRLDPREETELRKLEALAAAAQRRR